MPDWNAEFESLKARFNAGTIPAATEAELERYLLVLAHYIPHLGQQAAFDDWKQRIEPLIKYGLAKIELAKQAKGAELQIQILKTHHSETHALALESNRTGRIAIWIAGGSLFVAIVAAIFTAMQTYYAAPAHATNENNKPLTIPSITNGTPSKLPQQPTISPSNSAPPQAIQPTNIGPLKK